MNSTSEPRILESRSSMSLPALLKDRQSGSPCPGANGGQIGTLRQYNVLCGSRLAGKGIGGQKTESLGDCIDLCNDHAGPRCDGVIYDRNGQCTLQAFIDKSATKLDSSADSAIAAGTSQKPSSSCNSLGSGSLQSANGATFQLSCGKVVNGNDIESQFQMTLEECMRACAKNPGCGGVGFEASQSFAFKNCYLKFPFSANQLLAQSSIDTAMLVSKSSSSNNNNNNNINNGNGQGSGSGSQNGQIQVTMTIVTSLPTSASLVTTTIYATPQPGSDNKPGIGNANTSGKNQGAMAANSTDPTLAESDNASVTSAVRIGAPVAGAVVFLAIVAFLVFYFCRRRRRRRQKEERQARMLGALGEAPPDAEKGGWGRDDSRHTSMGGGLIRRDTTVSTSESRDNSLNGLKQNQVSTKAYGGQWGIPSEFAGPRTFRK